MKPIKLEMQLLLISVLLMAPFARAQEISSGAADADFERGFGEAQGITQAEKLLAEDDRFRIGGTIWSEAYYYSFDNPAQSDLLQNPNSLWLYGEARMRNDIRGFAKGRLIFDSTADGSRFPSPITGQPSRPYTSILEELKLQFSASKRVFFTVGKQKIKWGSGRFWNPTDFINTARRDPLRPIDDRAGVTLVKAHLPVKSANFYLIEQLDGSDRLENLGHAARAEFALASSEFALSALAKKSRNPVFGIDGSSALWDFDVNLELAYSKDATRWTGGISYEAKYSDVDTVAVGIEYFRNGGGATDISQYMPIFLSGRYVPFYLSRDYGAFFVSLPKPGGWNDVTFSWYNLFNLTDRSAISRLDSWITLMQDLQFNAAVAGHFGSPSGEFKTGGQRVDLTLGLKIDF